MRERCPYLELATKRVAQNLSHQNVVVDTFGAAFKQDMGMCNYCKGRFSLIAELLSDGNMPDTAKLRYGNINAAICPTGTTWFFEEVTIE